MTKSKPIGDQLDDLNKGIRKAEKKLKEIQEEIQEINRKLRNHNIR
jgi:prefoldin subunit 5